MVGQITHDLKTELYFSELPHSKKGFKWGNANMRACGYLDFAFHHSAALS